MQSPTPPDSPLGSPNESPLDSSFDSSTQTPLESSVETPQFGAPMPSTPLQGGVLQGAPMQGAPIQGAPIQGAPMGSIPSAYPPSGTPQKSGSGKLLLGCGLLGCVLPLMAFIALAIIGSIWGGSKNSVTNSVTGTSTSGKSTITSADITPYVGKWQGADSTSIWIRSEGKGDYDGGSTHVTGGGVTVDPKAGTLAITSFFGIGKTWKIDSEPHEVDGHTQMTLDGTVYRRQGGFDAAPTSNGKSTSGKADENTVPDDDELNKLIKDTLKDFDNAVKRDDFSDFYLNTSQFWQKQTTAAALKTTFSPFVKSKINIAPVQSMTPEFEQSPQIETDDALGKEVLVADGYFDTHPSRVNFKLKYIVEDNAWKLVGINVNVDKAP